jgi:hypothetical protein
LTVVADKGRRGWKLIQTTAKKRGPLLYNPSTHPSLSKLLHPTFLFQLKEALESGLISDLPLYTRPGCRGGQRKRKKGKKKNESWERGK